MRGLENKNAVVTGGGGAIGGAIARRLADAGARVGVFDVNAEGASATCAAIEKSGGSARPVTLDITDNDAVRAAIAGYTEASSPIDVLVNCAGWDRVRRFVDTDAELWDRLIAINLRGLIHMTHAVLPSMIERKSGRIVNIASDAGRVGSSGEAVYAACKGGNIAFTKSIAREVASKGITVNTVCPGPTETPILEAFKDEGEYGQRIHQALYKVIPMKRIGQPEDVQGIVAFLASDEASFITGQVISVSGGLTMNG